MDKAVAYGGEACCLEECTPQVSSSRQILLLSCALGKLGQHCPALHSLPTWWLDLPSLHATSGCLQQCQVLHARLKK